MPASQMSQLLDRPGFKRYFATVAAARATGTMFTVSGVLLVLERTHDLTLAGSWSPRPRCPRRSPARSSAAGST